MKFMRKWERKMGKYAIPNLMKILIFCYALGYVIQLAVPSLMGYLTLEPLFILRGQVWRLLTWVLVPESGFNILFTLIMLFFYYSIGTRLEQTWGDFRFNLYIFGGIILTDIAAMILYFAVGGGASIIGMGSLFSTYYINMSLFLAYAVCYPELEILFMMIIPVKMKWMGLIYGVMVLYSIVTAGWVGRTAIIASLLNFLIFFLLTRDFRRVSPKEVRRRQNFKRQIKPNANGTVHKCTICGRTEKDGEELEFRFCSKCAGNHEYCQDHLFTHQHIKHK
ncbi:MAG: hypothetical protein RR364_01090 [Lachnospiraceae bacterium]